MYWRIYDGTPQPFPNHFQAREFTGRATPWTPYGHTNSNEDGQVSWSSIFWKAMIGGCDTISTGHGKSSMDFQTEKSTYHIWDREWYAHHLRKLLVTSVVVITHPNPNQRAVNNLNQHESTIGQPLVVGSFWILGSSWINGSPMVPPPQ